MRIDLRRCLVFLLVAFAAVLAFVADPVFAEIVLELLFTLCLE